MQNAKLLPDEQYKHGQCPYCATELVSDTVLLFYYCPNDGCPGDFALLPTTFTELENHFKKNRKELRGK